MTADEQPTVAATARRTLAPFGRRLATITDVERLGAYVILTASDPEPAAPRPGQFYMLASEDRWGGGAGERPYLPRAFSVLRAPVPGALQFMLEDVGPGTERLCELRRGNRMWITGPLGIGFDLDAVAPDGRTAVLCGGGVGTAPLAALQDALRAAAIPEVALLGFRDGAHAAGGALLADARLATDDGAAGHHGLVTDLLDAELDRLGDGAVVFACGPPPMLEAIRVRCVERGVPGQLALESGMACGYGACFGCVVPTTDGLIRLCVDGPVLDAARLTTALVAGAGH